MGGGPRDLYQDAGPGLPAHRRGAVDGAAGYLVVEEVEIPVQVNGKVRGHITVPSEAGEQTIRSAALANEAVQKYLEGKAPQKVIVVQQRLVSIVV